ncbi:MAG: WbuC family cupin fold metalloprotein [Bacteroidales bacterium]|nr:WbuC family cupin fold metalloprotein [Bacteroidales bacterium]
MVIDDKLLDSLLEKAAESPRLRTNLDLRNGPEDGSQRMLNAMLPGTQVPIHRHRDTSESFVVLRGALTEIFYDDRGVECARHELGAISNNANHSNQRMGLQIPAGMWHTLIVHEPTVILECKDGAFAPLSSEDVWNYE